MQRLPKNLFLIALIVFASACLPGQSGALGDWARDAHQLPLAQLESRLSAASAELKQLATITFRGGVGSVGWESRIFDAPELAKPQWLTLHFDQEYLADQIALTPMLTRLRDGRIQSVGFPLSFEVRLGLQDDNEGKVVASFDDTSGLLPRTAPVVIPISPTRASWLKIEVSRLSAVDEQQTRFQLQLSEVMVFSGEENVALGAVPRVSSVRNHRVSRAINARGLVDGFTPYLMTAARGPGSGSCVFFFSTGPQACLRFDLGELRRINRIHLHSAHRREKFPQMHHADYAMPDHFIVEGASKSDFSDAVRLYEYLKNSIYDSGPILAARFAEKECRFVRLLAMEAYKAPEAKECFRCLGFSEIEIFEEGRNVVAGILPAINSRQLSRLAPIRRDGKLEMLTDGQNEFGTVLSQRQWVSQLSQRHELERSISSLEFWRDRRYQEQSSYFRMAIAGIGALVIVTIGIVLANRGVRKREFKKLTERFAADLHDEVGADLHAIGLLSDLAKGELTDNVSGNLSSLLGEIRSVTEDASRSVRQMSNSQTEAPYAKLVDLMNQWAGRILIGVDHELIVEGDHHISSLSPQIKSQLLLFFKECLVNASRHSQATKLTTKLTATEKKITLCVQDNGRGITTESDLIPASLARRAKLLGAEVNTDSGDQRGTTVHMEFSRRRWRFF